MDAFFEFLANPIVDASIHVMIAVIFIMELWQHWTHHKKQKSKREEPVYTLDEARVILFDEALNKVPSRKDISIFHNVAKRN